MSKYRRLIVLIIVTMNIILFGCQPATTNYFRGASAAEMGAIAITADLKNEQVWQDLYLTVNYQLFRTDDRLNITGSMGFSESSKTNYNRVSDMKLKLFLLDENLIVIDSMDIARTLSYRLDDETKFNRTLPLDSHVVALAFGYDGYLVDSDPEYPSVDPVWKIPKK
jgi:hypothetical protein